MSGIHLDYLIGSARAFRLLYQCFGLHYCINPQGVATIAKNATVEASDAYLAQPSEMRDSIRSVPYDQVCLCMHVHVVRSIPARQSTKLSTSMGFLQDFSLLSIMCGSVCKVGSFESMTVLA